MSHPPAPDAAAPDAAGAVGAGFQRYLAAAEGRPGLWRFGLGLLAVILGWALSSAAVVGIFLAISALSGHPFETAFAELEHIAAAPDPLTVALTLLSFAGIWAGLAAALPALHGRPFGSLFGPARRLERRGFAAGAALGLGLYGLTLAIAILLTGPPVFSAESLPLWALWLPVLAGLVLVQAGAEELLFRGYLAQEIGRRIASPLAWAVLPSVLFGLLHHAPHLPGQSAALYVGVTFLFGLTASLLVWHTGGLSMAIGLHTGLNLAGLTLAGLEGVVSGAQLWVFAADQAETLLAADLAASAAVLAVLASPWGRRLVLSAATAGPRS